MPIYDRNPASEYEILDRWDAGIGWLAPPSETGRRTSHAIVGDDGGVWVIDPIDAPGIDEELSTLGEVQGVIVCSNYHVRDADVFASRHDVRCTARRGSPARHPDSMLRSGAGYDRHLRIRAASLPPVSRMVRSGCISPVFQVPAVDLDLGVSASTESSP